MHIKQAGTSVVLALIISAGMTGPAKAAEQPAPIKTESATVITDYGVKPTDEQVDAAFAKQDLKGPRTRKNGTGSGGFADFAGSGCRRATVTHKAHTLTGKWAASYITWTDWCYNNNAKKKANRITRTDAGFYVKTASFFHYTGQVSKRTLEYTNSKGLRKFLHFREGTFKNEIPGPWPTVNTFHMANATRAFSWGTYDWATGSPANPKAV